MPHGDKTVDSILAQFDAVAEDYRFPDLGHGYYFAVDARLHAYADRERWALVVETVGYNPRAGDVLNVLHYFGNCLTNGRPGFENEDFLGRIENFDDVEDEDEPETAAGVNPVVRGTLLDVSAQSGEDLSDLFRRLVPAHRDLLLADEVELRRRLPHDIPEVLRLEEWHQPDLFETKPSQNEVYRELAQVLANADPSLYDPTQEPNTNWTYWPDSGGL